MAKINSWNGWRRLWVVLSAAALLFALVTAVNNVSPNLVVDQKVVSGFDDPQCKYLVDLPIDLTRHQDPEYNEPCWPMYLSRLFEKTLRGTDLQSSDDYREDIRRKRRADIFGSLLAFLTLWLVAIGLLYGLGLVVAWVRRGFAQPTDRDI